MPLASVHSVPQPTHFLWGALSKNQAARFKIFNETKVGGGCGIYLRYTM